jgi:hypothetical protein
MPPVKDTLDALASEVSNTIGAEESAVVVLDGIAARIKTAVAEAVANGATAEQLAPITDEVAALTAAREKLAAAVAANGA